VPEAGGNGAGGPPSGQGLALRRAAAKTARVLRHPILELGGTAVVSLIVGFVLGAGLLLLLHVQHWLPNSNTRQVDAFSEVPPATAGELAERFRPWLLFDSAEQWRPLDIEYFIGEGTSKFCTRVKGGTECFPLSTYQEFSARTKAAGALGPQTYLQIAGHKLRDYHGPDRCLGILLDCGRGYRSAMYYHVTQANGRFYVDYWWFLRFNHLAKSVPGISCLSHTARENEICDEHQGDWEGVTVVSPPDDDKHLAYVVYAAHKGTFRYTASQLHLEYGTRPVVYVAAGSHASYPQACTSGNCVQPSGLAAVGLLNLPDGNYDGKLGWARNYDRCPANVRGSWLQSLSGQPWATWPGQWGAGCGDACGGAVDTNSPRSPGLQARYQTPWCSTQGGVFSCDGRALSCTDWLGPLVAAVACDPSLLSATLSATGSAKPSQLALIVGGIRTVKATIPGVVQTLGQPFRLGTSFTVIPDDRQTEILVRARQSGVTVEDRFAGPPIRPGHPVRVSVTRGSDGPTVLANGSTPVERRILEPVTAIAK